VPGHWLAVRYKGALARQHSLLAHPCLRTWPDPGASRSAGL